MTHLTHLLRVELSALGHVDNRLRERDLTREQRVGACWLLGRRPQRLLLHLVLHLAVDVDAHGRALLLLLLLLLLLCKLRGVHCRVVAHVCLLPLSLSLRLCLRVRQEGRDRCMLLLWRDVALCLRWLREHVSSLLLHLLHVVGVLYRLLLLCRLLHCLLLLLLQEPVVSEEPQKHSHLQHLSPLLLGRLLARSRIHLLRLLLLLRQHRVHQSLLLPLSKLSRVHLRVLGVLLL